MASSKTLSADQIALLVAVIQHSQPQIPQSEWESIAEKLGIKCAKAAKERFRYLMNHLNGNARVRKKATAKQSPEQQPKVTSMAKVKKSTQDFEQMGTDRVKAPGSGRVTEWEESSEACLGVGESDKLVISNIKVEGVDELVGSEIRVEELDDLFTEMESKRG